MVKINLQIYNLTRGTAANYSATENNNPEPVRIKDGIINVYAYQTFDECMSINPQTGSMKTSEDLKML